MLNARLAESVKSKLVRLQKIPICPKIGNAKLPSFSQGRESMRVVLFML